MAVAGTLLGNPLPTTAAAPARGPISIRYEGKVDLEAHFARPGDTRPFQSEQRFATDGKGRVRLDWTTWTEGDTTREPETYLVDRDAVYYRRAPGASWLRLSGERARLGRLQALAGLPDQLLDDAGRAKGKVRPKIEVDRGRLQSYLIQHAHPRLGDVWDSVELTYDQDDFIPERLTMKIFERDQSWTLAAQRTDVSADAVPDSLLRAPATFEEAPREEVPSGPPKIVAIAPGVWGLEMADIDSRSLVVEFADYVAVIEWAVGSANGERMVDAVHHRWPRKPIRYAFFSHHHPHYVGGIRAAVADGAVVVTTPGNVGVVRRAAHATFRLEPDRLSRKLVDPEIRTFTERFEIGDSTNQLIAINYGPRSLHTDEFAIFWLPRQKILFEAELGWAGSEGALRAGRRASALLGYLSDQHLDAETIVQSWPMRGIDGTLTRARLEELVRGASR